MGPLEILLLALTYTFVLLVEKYDIRDRLVTLAGVQNLTETTSALTDAGTRLLKLLLIQAAVNAAYGLWIGVGLLPVLGIPSAAPWAITAAVLRFIPFVGVVIAALPPLPLAAAVNAGWSMFVATFALSLFGELLLTNSVEPAPHGRHVGMSALGVFAAASFWSVIWRALGLLLAAPLTMCLVVAGEYAPSLAFLSLIFGNRPSLTPPREHRHRLLSGDAIGAADALEEAMEGESVSEELNRVVFSTMRLAAAHQKARELDEIHMRHPRETMSDFFLSRLSLDRGAESANVEATKPRLLEVDIVSANGPIDSLLAPVLGRLFSRDADCACHVAQHGSGMIAISSPRGNGARGEGRIVMLSTMGGATRKQLLILARRAARAMPELKILARDWAAGPLSADEPNDALPENVIVRTAYSQALGFMKRHQNSTENAKPDGGDPGDRRSLVENDADATRI